MEVAFSSKELRQICESYSAAKKLLGEVVADKLCARLSDIEACRNYSDMVLGEPYFITINNIEVWVVSISGSISLIFEANHQSPPLDKNNQLMWEHVTRLKLMDIHDLRRGNAEFSA